MDKFINSAALRSAWLCSSLSFSHLLGCGADVPAASNERTATELAASERHQNEDLVAGSTQRLEHTAIASAPVEGDNPAILLKAQTVWLGAYYGDKDLLATSAKLRRMLPLHMNYYGWNDDWVASSKVDLDAGRTPFVTWEPYATTLDDIAQGAQDGMLHARARAAKALNQKLFVDFAPEMNGDWSPWSGAQNGMSPDPWLAAYRHIHDLFTEDGASNIVWLWCPNSVDIPNADWNRALNYYPGDDYVDWTCMNGYNWGGASGGRWQSFREVFSGMYGQLASKGKPIMIGETASTEVGGNKTLWLRQIVSTLRRDFPLVRGMIWFDVDKEEDWRISSSTQAEWAFIGVASNSYFAQ